MSKSKQVAVIDYGLGNIYSIVKALEHAGLEGIVTDDTTVLSEAPAVILPGVGAFGDAMNELQSRDLVDALKNFAATGKPMLGICLGMQLLMEHSDEFGTHDGLGLIPGKVVRFSEKEAGAGIKVPQVGWNTVCPVKDNVGKWNGTLLEGTAPGEYMYFVHSYYVKPTEETDVLGLSQYGDTEYCSAVLRSNVMGVQFHPEKSGRAGLAIYDNFARIVL